MPKAVITTSIGLHALPFRYAFHVAELWSLPAPASTTKTQYAFFPVVKAFLILVRSGPIFRLAAGF